MNELVKTIDELYAAFKTDAELQAGKYNYYNVKKRLEYIMFQPLPNYFLYIIICSFSKF